MTAAFTESEVEEAALAWLEELGYEILHGPEIAPGELFSEREAYEDPTLPRRLRESLARLNLDLPASAREEVFRRLTLSDAPSLIQNNRRFHRFLVDGVPV